MEYEPSPSNSVAIKKNPSGKPVLSSQRMVLITLYKDLKRENPTMKYKPMIQLLSKKTGIGQITISKTLAEYRKTGSVMSPGTKRARLSIKDKTSEENINMIRRKVHEFWLLRDIPTVKKIHSAVNEDPTLPVFSESTLYRLLKSIQFKVVSHVRNTAVLDTDYIVAWRQKYLEAIARCRAEGRHIYYLDESWVHMPNIPDIMSNGKRLIMAHIGSSDGFVPDALLCVEAKKRSGNRYDEMSGDVFFQWFRSVLTKLKDSSVIVMDNASYHCTKLEKYPTMTWKKNRIIAWLVAKGEKVPPHYVKVMLLELVQKHKKPESNYLIDKYAKQHNHIILRLPPYHCQLNPMELAWEMVKDYVKAQNSPYTLEDAKNLLINATKIVSAETWKNFTRCTTEEENKLHHLDIITDDMLDDWTEAGEQDEQEEEEDEEEEGEEEEEEDYHDENE